MYKYIKSILDYFFAAVLVILFLPLCFVIAILVRLDSKGPIIFKQRRIYKPLNKIFYVYKFRSMVFYAREFQEYDKEKQKLVTRFGKILREFHFDELPQFFNILQGKMSFIGPRPQFYRNEIRRLKQNPKRAKRYQVKGGIVSIERLINLEPKFKNQIISHLPKAKYLKKATNRIDFDYYYVNHISFKVDMIIVYYFFKLLIDKFFSVIIRGEFEQYERLKKREILK